MHRSPFAVCAFKAFGAKAFRVLDFSIVLRPRRCAKLPTIENRFISVYSEFLTLPMNFIGVHGNSVWENGDELPCIPWTATTTIALFVYEASAGRIFKRQTISIVLHVIGIARDNYSRTTIRPCVSIFGSSHCSSTELRWKRRDRAIERTAF